MVRSSYPALQSISTYYSLIGAVYLFRPCAWFMSAYCVTPRYRWISLVLSISRNCLAPPHVPESRIARFIPQCIYSIYSTHLSLYLSSSSVLNVLCIPVAFCLDSEICLVPVSNSLYLFPIILPCPVSPVFVVLLYFYLLLFASVTPPPLEFSLFVFASLFGHCYMFICISGFDAVLCSRWLLSLPNVLYLILSDYLASGICFCIGYDFCLGLIKSLFHVTPLCIWVLSIHLHFTFRNNICYWADKCQCF